MSQSNIRSGRITAIEDQARHPERVSVFIEGAFAFGLSRLVAAQHGVRVGGTLSAADVTALLQVDEAARATEAALQLLAYRARSAHEVQTRLARRGFSETAITATISKLREWRYLDDEDFARQWVENRNEYQPRGRRRLQQELRAKGVDPEVAARAIDEAEIDELPDAIELARRRAQQLTGLDALVRRRRLAGYLQRRGYSWDVVRAALDAVLDEDPDEDPS